MTIAHVARTGEDRGRVVLRMRPSAVAHDIALEAAVRIAQAFESEVESLFVEEQELLELASYPFAYEVSLTGRRALSRESMERDMRAVGMAMLKKLEAIARRAEVPVRSRSVRGEAIHALASACEECGPWNVVALAEPFSSFESQSLKSMFEMVAGTTGIVIVGPRARRTSGAVVAVVEDIDLLPGMLRAAERIGATSEAPVVLLLIAESEERAHLMDGQARLMLAGRTDVSIAAAGIARGAPAVAAEMLRRLHGGFVIAQFGGLLVPVDDGLGPLAAALECPILLVR